MTSGLHARVNIKPEEFKDSAN